MGFGAVAEPLVVVTLLFGGAWINRNTASGSYFKLRPASPDGLDKRSDDRPSSSDHLRKLSDSFSVSSLDENGYLQQSDHARWRNRKIRFLRRQRIVTTPNTTIFRDRLLSRLLRKFPFLVEAWYWALIYWVYQLGRAFTAVTLVEGTVDVARKHALQVIHLEQALGLFVEKPIQTWFLERPSLMLWTNRVYSFIHIPGTILFLVVLYYFTTTRQRHTPKGTIPSYGGASPALYEARRRTMALCNLLAFIVFTLWPCMPPRLLSDPEYDGEMAAEAKSYGFIDTVHSKDGESSVWTQNKFCNQYAAMPSLHFGYSLLVGLTIATLPVAGVRKLSWKRLVLIGAGMSYPFVILAAIVSTANHFVLDAVAGAMVCGIAWCANDVLLNLLVLEDYFLWIVRIHKPVNCTDPETAVEDGWSEYGLQSV